MIVIQNLDTVTIDGVIYGNVVTATLQKKDSAEEIQSALVAFFNETFGDVEKLNTEMRASINRGDALVAVAEKLKEAFQNDDAAKFDEAATELVEVKKPEKDKRLAEIDEQIAALEAKRAEIAAQAGLKPKAAAKIAGLQK